MLTYALGKNTYNEQQICFCLPFCSSRPSKMEKNVFINSGEASFYKRKETVKTNYTKEKLYRTDLPTNSWLVEISLLYLQTKFELCLCPAFSISFLYEVYVCDLCL